MLEVKPGFGLVSDEIDLSKLGGADAGWLRNLISTHGVVVFRNQSLDDAGFITVLELLGPMIFTAGETPLPDQPMLNAVSNVARATPPRSVFHTDSSYMPAPPAYTGLRAVTVPAAGGATLITDQYDAADRLSEDCRTALAGRFVRHVVTGLEGRRESCWHPLLRRHPVTGRTALFLSTPERCREISGMDPDQSARLIALLYRLSIRPTRLFQHHWQAGDIVIWDDRCTMHRADHEGTVGQRVLHRGLVGGEAPIAATAAENIEQHELPQLVRREREMMQ